MRGRALVRWLIVITAVAGMMLAPVVTWPSSGSPAPARVPTASTGPAHPDATSGPSQAEPVRGRVTPPEVAATAV